MKEYTEHELWHVSEADAGTWVHKKALAVLKDGKGVVEGIIDIVEKSRNPNTPQSIDFLWVSLVIGGKRYRIDTIESLKIM